MSQSSDPLAPEAIALIRERQIAEIRQDLELGLPQFPAEEVALLLSALDAAYTQRDISDEAWKKAEALLLESREQSSALAAQVAQLQKDADELHKAWDAENEKRHDAEAERDVLRAALTSFRALLVDFKEGTVVQSKPRGSGPGKHRHAAEVREVATIQKTLNVVIAEFDKALTAGSRIPHQ